MDVVWVLEIMAQIIINRLKTPLTFFFYQLKESCQYREILGVRATRVQSSAQKQTPDSDTGFFCLQLWLESVFYLPFYISYIHILDL